MSATNDSKLTNTLHNQTSQRAAASVATLESKPAANQTVPQTKPMTAAQALVVQAPHDSVPVRITSSPTDYLGPGVAFGAAILTAAVGWLVIRAQLKQQRRDAQTQHRADTRAQLHLEAYREFQLALSRFYACDSPEVKIDLIRNELHSAIQFAQQGLSMQISARVSDFGAKLATFLKVTNDLKFFLERYESLLPGFDIFKTALSSAMYDAVMHRPALDGVMLRWLPMDGVDRNGHPLVLNQQVISPAVLQEFDIASQPLKIALGQAQMWVLDLAVESQNFLLGDYADKPVARRTPLNQTYFTVTVDPRDRDRLNALFNGTEYAAANAAAMAQAHARYAATNTSP